MFRTNYSGPWVEYPCPIHMKGDIDVICLSDQNHISVPKFQALCDVNDRSYSSLETL